MLPGRVWTVDFLTALDVLKRRWILVVTGMILTVLGVFGVLRAVDATYTAHGDYLLLVPNKSESPESRTNPYLFFESGLSVTAEIIITAMTDQSVGRGLDQISETAKYEVVGTQGAAPVVVVEVTDNNPETALSGQEFLSGEISAFLASRQKDVDAPKAQTIKVMPLTSPIQAEKSQAKALRAVIALAVVGLGTTLLGVFAVDAVIRRRESARHSGGTTPAGVDDLGQPEGDVRTEVPVRA